MVYIAIFLGFLKYLARKGFHISSKENPLPNEGLTNIAEFTYETVQKTYISL